MRIRHVTIEGFGPFKERQEVDFAAFDADGLFLIGGETGSGKSTILDAITYALYNGTPRWEDVGATGVASRVRSDYCTVDDPTEVILEFEANGREYRVTRAPEYERPKKGAREGTTRQLARVLVEELQDDGTWTGLATKERDAAEHIARLVKLNENEFLQVILLAQGRFQKFLLADTAERLELLSKLFGTRRFADYQVRIAERRSALARQVAQAGTELKVLLGSVVVPDDAGSPPDDNEPASAEPGGTHLEGTAPAGQELAWIDQIIERAKWHLSRSTDAIAAAEQEEQAAEGRLDVARRQDRVAVARRRLAELDAQRADIAQAKAQIARAERAERVRALLDAATDAHTACDAADAAASAARRTYAGVADDALAGEVSRLDGEIGALAEALTEEKQVGRLDRDLAAKATEVAAIEQAIAAAAERIGALQAERETLAQDATQVEPRREKADRARLRLDAAIAAQGASVRLRAAQQAQLAADRKHTAARQRADDLLEQFLRGQAAALAATLVPGEPCAVCGSTVHPSPAAWPQTPVDEKELKAAQAKVDTAERAATTARLAVADLQAEVATLTATAGGGDVPALTAELAIGQEELAAATNAAQRLGEIDAELCGDTGLLAQRVALEDSGKAAGTELTRLEAERDALGAKVARLRGDYPSVKARHGALVAERRAAKALADAVAALRTATRQRDDADAKLAAKSAQEGFAGAEDVVAALLGEAERAELRGRVDAHETAVNQTQGVLSAPDLQGLPDDVIDLAAARRAHAAARAGTRAAAAARANAQTAVDTLGRQRVDLVALLAASGTLNAEYQVLQRLAETVQGKNAKGMSLQSYYVAAELEEVLAAANGRLRAMSDGRYALAHTERGVQRANAAAGLEIEVMDEFTGKPRDPHTLSGGEQFLASLALALGLAEVVTSRAGGVELATLFVDEGFGSLSPAHLDVAMATLDSLRQGGRTVGVISHVESMKESIAAQLQVVRRPGGWSQIAQRVDTA